MKSSSDESSMLKRVISPKSKKSVTYRPLSKKATGSILLWPAAININQQN